MFETQAFPCVSIASAVGVLILLVSGLNAIGTPWLFSISTLLSPRFPIQTLSLLSIARVTRGLKILSVPFAAYCTAIVQSLGAIVSAVWNGAPIPPVSPNSAPTLWPGYAAICCAAISVFVGVVKLVPSVLPEELKASLNSVVQLFPEPENEPFTQDARMSASVLISVWGTAPLPFGVSALAVPVLTFARLPAVVNAF